MAFDFDTEAGGGGGEQGPFIKWYTAGSAAKSIPPKTFAIRGKAEGEEEYTETIFEKFTTTGVVLNLESTKQGWEKDVTNGAPERVYAPQCDPRNRPDDSKKQSGAFAWSNLFGIRVATGGAETAWWSDASWGGYEAFKRLAKQIHAEADANPGKAPLVKMTGIEEGQSKNGKFAVPILTVTSWVRRPTCFDAEPAMAFDTGEPASLPPAASPAPAPAPSPEDGEFQ